MNQATYDTISGYNLIDNYKVHYYFDKYTGGASNAHVYSDGDSQYSGKILAYDTMGNHALALDLFTGNLGTGTFSGGVNEFYDHVTIANSSDLFSGEFTFLISAQTTSRQDLGESQKGPVSNNNILFSNLKSGQIISVDEIGETCTGERYSGWQIGINASNRVYLESYNNYDPLITTYMGEQPPYSQNIWGLVYNGGNLKVGLYDISTEVFSFNSHTIDVENLDTRSPWEIGSGINFDPDTKFSPLITLNSGLFAGGVNNFLYFNIGMEDAVINTVAKSLYSDLYEKAGPTSYLGTGMVLYTLTGLDISGLVASGFDCSVTGYETGYVQFDEIREITGTLTGAMTYYLFFSQREHAISGVVNTYRSLWATGDVAVDGGVVPPTGITGFLTVNHETGIETAISGCSGTGVSGLIFSSSGLSGGTISGVTGTLMNAVSGISGQPTQFSRPNALSYIGEPLGYDGVIEKYSVGGFGTIDVGELNNLANVGDATMKPGYGFYIKTSANPDSLSLYLNGVGREQGEMILRTTSTSETFVENGTTYARTACGTIIELGEATAFEIEMFFNKYRLTSGSCFVSGIEIMEELTFPSWGVDPTYEWLEDVVPPEVWLQYLANIAERDKHRAGPNDLLYIYDTGLNTGTVRSRAEVTSTLDYTDTIQHAQGTWSPRESGSYIVINGVALGEGSPTCWAAGGDITITWPAAAGIPWMDPVAAEIDSIEDLGFGELFIEYKFLIDSVFPTGVPPHAYDITVELDPPCSLLSSISGDQWVFFNGQKLISGINYIDHPTSGFTPSGYITGIKGTYFTFPPVEGTTQSTGDGLSFEGSYFFPNSSLIFINGVRQDLSTYYVEHSNTKDLISGKETLKTYGDLIYNNYN
jgi:hypothetical protein